MGILSSIFPKSFPRHDSVPSYNNDSDAAQVQRVLKEIRDGLSSNKPLNIDFQRLDKARVSVDFTGRNLNIDVFHPDGARSEFKTSDSYMGAVQWGGGINFYNQDGSFQDGGVYPRKFNSALDVFNYTLEKLQANEFKPKKKQSNRDSVSTTLHQPLLDSDLESVKTITETGQIINPKEVAQDGALPKFKLGDKEFALKHLTNGRLLESESRKIFLRNNNVYHHRLIDKLDSMVHRDSKPYGSPSELGEMMGVKGMITTKAQPFYEADGITLVKEEQPKLLTRIPSNPAIAA